MMVDKDLVRRAFVFAQTAHAGQWRKSGLPFITHPVAVANNLAGLQADAPTLAAALLHDVLEDTPVTYEQIDYNFGSEIACLVEAVTKDCCWDDVRDREHNFRHKLAQAIIKDARVGLIRLADRLSNFQDLDALSRARQLRMAQETLVLYVPLAHCYGLPSWGDKLLQLALRYLLLPSKPNQADRQQVKDEEYSFNSHFIKNEDNTWWTDQMLSLFLYGGDLS